MEEDKSMRAASRIMEEECQGRWKANNIRQLWKLWMGKILPTKPRVIDDGVVSFDTKGGPIQGS